MDKRYFCKIKISDLLSLVNFKLSYIFFSYKILLRINIFFICFKKLLKITNKNDDLFADQIKKFKLY